MAKVVSDGVVPGLLATWEKKEEAAVARLSQARKTVEMVLAQGAVAGVVLASPLPGDRRRGSRFEAEEGFINKGLVGCSGAQAPRSLGARRAPRPPRDLPTAGLQRSATRPPPRLRRRSCEGGRRAHGELHPLEAKPDAQ